MDLYLRFRNLEEMTSCDREITVLKTLCDELTRIKFKFLAEDEALLNSYESLVMKSLVSEEEFWNQKEEIREWSKISSLASQPLARTSTNLIKSLYTGGNTKIEGLKFNELSKMKLLKREPLLMKRYLEEVQEKGIRDEDFWKIFEDEQKEKNTVLVGGVNPIYIAESFSQNKKIEMNIEIDILRNTETFDLTTKLYENPEGEKKTLIDMFNERNVRVLNDDLLREEKKDQFFKDENETINHKPKLKNYNSVKNSEKSCTFKENERKMYVWEEEAWGQIKRNFSFYEKEIEDYKNIVFKDDNKQARNVFEQMMRHINQRLSKKNFNFSQNEDESLNFQKNWKVLHQEANKILSFFYLNLKKASSEEKNKNKYLQNCQEIARIMVQIKEKINKLKGNNNKISEIVSKCLNNLQDRVDSALKFEI